MEVSEMTMILDPFSTLFDPGRRRPQEGWGRAFIPAGDLLVGEEDVRLVMDVPGLKAEDLEIELADGMLSIRGERRYPYREDEAQELNRLERGYGRFERTLSVPKAVEPSTLSASIEDGVLTLRTPLPRTTTHRIEVAGPGAMEAIDTTATDGGASGEAVAENNGHRELAGAAS
jgi:HSP20 family protein